MAAFKKIFSIVGFSFSLFVLESIIKYFYINKISFKGFYFFSGNLQISRYENPNIAFSLPVPQVLIIIFTLVILIFLGFIWWKSLIKNQKFQLLALSLIIVGALSNLFDRLIFGYVIDYINVFFWPIFNLADVMIVSGVFIYIIVEFKNTKIRNMK